MKKPLFPALLALCLLLHPAVANDLPQIDWAATAISQTRNDEARYALLGVPPEARIVTVASEPPTPFGEAGAALFINATMPKAPWFRLLVRPFQDREAAEGGEVTFPIRLVGGRVNIQLGHNPSEWVGADAQTHAVASGFLTFSLEPGARAEVQRIPLRGQTSDDLKAEENYTVSIRWRQAGAQTEFSFLINGEPLMQENGTPFVHSVPSEKGAFNAMRILLGSREEHAGAFYLGPISARAGAGE